MMTEETYESNAKILSTDEPKKCAFCERAGAIFGMLLGGIILFIGADLLMGGRLSNLISGGMTEETDDES